MHVGPKMIKYPTTKFTMYIREMVAKLVAHLLRQLSGFESIHLQKYKIGDKSKGVADIL